MQSGMMKILFGESGRSVMLTVYSQVVPTNNWDIT